MNYKKLLTVLLLLTIVVWFSIFYVDSVAALFILKLLVLSLLALVLLLLAFLTIFLLIIVIIKIEELIE